MRNRKHKALIWTATVFIAALTFSLLSHLYSWAGSVPSTPSLDELRAEVQALRQEAAMLEEENRGLRKVLADQEDGELYVVVDTESNRLTLRQGETVLHTAVAGTGSRRFIEAETGANWFFETPIGSFTVLGKERNPVWIRPDWSYVEENMPIPPPRDPDRIVRGVLGKYALLLGNGYKIHGTKWTKLLGTHFTHGCVSLGDKDLEMVYNSVKIGTKVYLF
ncbi:MAG TPA: L,D-transpeptidase family protein [Nitrospirota bacterium]|nr:L,D-transpeptidase family protein [Nitrospirota bacterium]